MDDIFYLSSEKVNLKDIKEIAEELKVKKVVMAETQNAMEITYWDDTTACWANMELEEFHEPDDIIFFVKKKICVVFCISYHPINLNNLKPHIVKVLRKYGGWIGMDNDGFYPYYNLANIDSFMY